MRFIQTDKSHAVDVESLEVGKDLLVVPFLEHEDLISIVET